MIQTQENREKPHFGSDVGILGPNSGHQNSLDIMVSYYHVKYQI